MDAPPTAKRRVFFVCTGNTCRSPMAEVMFRRRASERGLDVDVASAGVAALPGAPASGGALRAMQARGLDLSTHSARHIDGVGLRPGDLVLVMTRGQRALLRAKYPHLAEHVHLWKEYVGAAGSPDVNDPFGGSDAAYETCAAEISDLVDLLVDKLTPKTESGGTA